MLGLEVESIVSRDVFKGLKNLKDLDLIYHGGTLPDGLFDSMVIKGLNLILTKATSLPTGIFQFGRKTLNTLQLVGENVSTLSEDLLDDLCVLSKLFLVMPSVKKLPERFFHSQKQTHQNMSLVCPANLQEVEITGIQTLPAKLFNQLANLETLQLQRIGSFPQMGFLAEVVNLRMLVITGSALTRIPAAWFKELYSLKTLKLSGVQLEELHNAAFKGLISLSYLDLSNNNLQQITGMMLKPLRQTLETLILSGNSLIEISGDCLSGLNSLRFLDASENQLTNIYADSFVGMTFLSVLYLNKNHLTSLPTDLFRDQLQLESLSVADNYLVEFPKAILKLKMSLVNLDLSSNELREVPASELCQFVYLEVVNLMGNSLHCDCSLLAFQHCPETSTEGQCKTPKEHFDKYLAEIEVPKSCDIKKQPVSAPEDESTEPQTMLESTLVKPESQQPKREEKPDSKATETDSSMPGSLGSNQENQPKVSLTLTESTSFEPKSQQSQGEEEKTNSKASQTDSPVPDSLASVLENQPRVPVALVKSTSVDPQNQQPQREEKSEAKAVWTDSDMQSTLGEEGSRSEDKTHQSTEQSVSVEESNTAGSMNQGTPNDTVIRELFTEEISTSHTSNVESTVSSGEESAPKPIQKKTLSGSMTTAVTAGVSTSSKNLDGVLVKEATQQTDSLVQHSDSVDAQKQRNDIDGAHKKENVKGSLGVGEAATTRTVQTQPNTVNSQLDVTSTEDSGSETAEKEQNQDGIACKTNTEQSSSEDKDGEADDVFQDSNNPQQKPNCSEGPSVATILPTDESPTATLSKPGTEAPHNRENGTGTFESSVLKNKKSEADDLSANSVKGSADEEMMGDGPVQASSDQSQQAVNGSQEKAPRKTGDETQRFRPSEDVNSQSQPEMDARQSGSSPSKPATRAPGNKSTPAQRTGDTTTPRSFMKDAPTGNRFTDIKNKVQKVTSAVQQNVSTDIQKQGDNAVGSHKKVKENAKGSLDAKEAATPQEKQQQLNTANGQLGVTPKEEFGSETEKKENRAGIGKTDTEQPSTENKASETVKVSPEDTDVSSQQNLKQGISASTLEPSGGKQTDTLGKPTEASWNENRTRFVKPNVLEENKSEAADSSVHPANGSMAEGDASVPDSSDQSQTGVDGNLKNNPNKTYNDSKILTLHPSEGVKNPLNMDAGQSGKSTSKPLLQMPGSDKTTLTQQKADTSISRSFLEVAVSADDGNTPEGQEIGNSGSEKTDESPEEAGKTPEKIAFNFTISALAALLVFCCTLLAIYGIRRWQHKGSYVISNHDSDDTEMNAMDSPDSKEVFALQEDDRSTPRLLDKPFR